MMIRRGFVAVLFLVPLAACPADDGSASGSSGDSGTASSTGADGADDAPPPTVDGTSTTPDDTTTMPPGTATDSDGTDTGPPPPSDGQCVGIDLFGFIGTVMSRVAAPPFDGTCEAEPMPCGGDPVGMWMFEVACGFESVPNPLESDCPGSTFVIDSYDVTGTMEFVDDGTFTQDVATTVQATATLDPMMCFGIDCAAFETILQMDSPGASCQAMGATCTCAVVEDSPGTMISGTWEVMGDELTITAGADSETYPFCITGDRFDFWTPIGEVVVTDELCATEQDCIDALGDAYDAYVCGMD